MATCQPLPSPPTVSVARAPSKNTSLNSLVPVSWRIGRTSIRPRLVHLQQQERQSVVAGGAGVGAGEDEAEVGVQGERGPDLLAGDGVAAGGGVRGWRWSVSRRGRSRRPVRCTPGTRGSRRGRRGGRWRRFCSSVPYVMRVGARRFSPMWPIRAGGSGPGVLLGPDDLLGEGGAAVAVRLAVLARPADADPASLAQLAFPRAGVGGGGVGEAVRQPGAHLGTKVHPCLLSPGAPPPRSSPSGD